MGTNLKSYSFSDEDIDLITFALRKLSKESDFATTQHDAAELIEYIERIKKENAS